MSLQRYQLLVALADAGTVTAAARASGISQPALSQHLRAIEGHYGFPLLMRTGRRVVLTRAAREVVSYARRIVRLAQESERAARELLELGSGRLSVGVTATPGAYLVPRILAEFHARFPAVELQVRLGSARDVEQWVLRGESDVGVIGEVTDPLEARVTPFRRDELVVVTAASHPLAALARLDGAALAAYPLIVREAASGTRQVLVRALAASGLALKVLFELPSVEAILQSVAAGLGASVVSGLAVTEPALGLRVRVRRVAGLDLSRYLGVVTHPDLEPGPGAREFIALLERGVARPTIPAA